MFNCHQLLKKSVISEIILELNFPHHSGVICFGSVVGFPGLYIYSLFLFFAWLYWFLFTFCFKHGLFCNLNNICFRLNSTYLGYFSHFACSGKMNFVVCILFVAYLFFTSPYVLGAFNSTGIQSMFTMFFCDSGGGVLHGKIMFSTDEHTKPERKRGAR